MRGIITIFPALDDNIQGHKKNLRDGEASVNSSEMRVLLPERQYPQPGSGRWQQVEYFAG